MNSNAITNLPIPRLQYEAASKLYVDGNARGPGGEWASDGETRELWIQIKCADMVRVWKVALRGRETNTQRIYRWKIDGSTDGQNYTTLYEPHDAVYLGNIVQQFAIETQLKFNHFRLFCIQAEGSNPGCHICSYLSIQSSD